MGHLGPGSTRVTSSRVGLDASWNSGAHRQLPCAVGSARVLRYPVGDSTCHKVMAGQRNPWAHPTHVLPRGRAWCSGVAMGTKRDGGSIINS